MNAQRLASMLTTALGFDTETHMTQPGLKAPPLVCASFAQWSSEAGRCIGKIVDAANARHVFVAALMDERITFVMANAVYDMLVMAVDAMKRGIDLMPAIFRAYEAGRVFDIQLAEALHGIALGMLGKDPRTGRKLKDRKTGKDGYYSLDNVHELVTGKVGAKANDRFRKSYALLEHIPIELWPPEAREYPVDDACNTLEDGLAQVGHIPNVGIHDFNEVDGGHECSNCGIGMQAGIPAQCVNTKPRQNLHDLSLQCYTHWCMELGAAWGFTVDQDAVNALEEKVTKDFVEDVKPFIAAGIIRADGTECQNLLKMLVAQAYGAKDSCPSCHGIELKGKTNPGKIISPKTLKTWINCPACDGTALHLPPEVPRAEGGGVSKGRDPLAESGFELLMSYAAFGEDKKIRTTYIPWLHNIDKQDVEHRDVAIVLSPNPLLETNRVSYRDKSQTLPRNGGVRECIVPRPGTVFYSCDYSGIELCTWAQMCLWMCKHSELAKAINAGINVHGALGAEMCGQSYEVFMARIKAGDPIAIAYRQAAKPGNFMFPGGGGIARFTQAQREQGPDTPHPTGPIIATRGDFEGHRIYRGTRFCLLIGGAPRCGEIMVTKWGKQDISPTCLKCLECAKVIKENWEKRWPEQKDYFSIINRISDQGYQIHPISKRKRGGVGYCDAANGYFQELAAQGAKDGLRHIVREQYDSEYRPPDLHGERSILYGNSRNIAFLHDENLGEALIPLAPECAERVSGVMEKRMLLYVPDVKIVVEPTLMPRWYKAAKCVRDESGRLQVWHPKKAA